MAISSTKNVKLGVCRIFFDGSDLGLTQGGVEFSVETTTHKVEVDQFGASPINEYIEGRTATVTAPLAETTLRNLIATMPGSSLVTDGVEAFATVTFAANPTASTTVTIDGVAFSFQVAKGTSLTQVKIGTTRELSLQAFVDQVNLRNVRNDIGGVTAELVAGGGGVVRLKCAEFGLQGNAITLTAASGATASGATFTGGVAATKSRADVTNGIGMDMLEQGRVLRLHPLGKADTDLSEDLIIYKAASSGAMNFAYQTDAERIYNATFTAYPDPVTGKLFSIGDPLA
jgi:hypothetical protein